MYRFIRTVFVLIILFTSNCACNNRDNNDEPTSKEPIFHVLKPNKIGIILPKYTDWTSIIFRLSVRDRYNFEYAVNEPVKEMVMINGGEKLDVQKGDFIHYLVVYRNNFSGKYYAQVGSYKFDGITYEVGSARIRRSFYMDEMTIPGGFNPHSHHHHRGPGHFRRPPGFRCPHYPYPPPGPFTQAPDCICPSDTPKSSTSSGPTSPVPDIDIRFAED